MGVIITGALWDLREQRYNELSGVGEGGKRDENEMRPGGEERS